MWKFKIQRISRRTHRYLAIATAAQLLIWTISGVFFAFVDINEVRGTPFKTQPAALLVPPKDLSWLPDDVYEVRVIDRLGDPIVGIKQPVGWQWRHSDGTEIGLLSSEQAQELVLRYTVFSPKVANFLESAPAGSEYRGNSLPLYQIYVQENPSTAVYIDALTGELKAIRSNTWRWWDFLWSLHIMDYDERDEIGTYLLKLFSVLSLLTAIAGLVLFVSSMRTNQSGKTKS
jgi:hypothetical protein